MSTAKETLAIVQERTDEFSRKHGAVGGAALGTALAMTALSRLMAAAENELGPFVVAVIGATIVDALVVNAKTTLPEDFPKYVKEANTLVDNLGDTIVSAERIRETVESILKKAASA